MFGKLLRYELQATARVIPIVYLVTFCLLLVQILTSGISNESISSISIIILALALMVQEVVTLALVVWRFYRSMCADEAYLTHALPVKSSSVLLSKLLVGCLWGGISRILSLVGWVVLLSEELPNRALTFFERFPAAIRMMTELLGIGKEDLPIVILFFVAQILSTALSLIVIYFAILVGRSPAFRRVGIFGIVLVGFLEYSAIQIISSMATFFVPLSLQFNIQNNHVNSLQLVAKSVGSTYLSLVARPESYTPAVFPIGLGGWLALPVMITLLFALTTYWMKRHTNLR